jgi:trans-2-enoyl-CoA reductase
MSTTLSKKSGKGKSHGVSSELTAFFHIRPGHTEALQAAIQRFQEKAQPKDSTVFEKVGLRTQRHVIFDNGTRVMWSTAFDTDWDPYIDDAIAIFGAENWVDWMQHTVEYSPAMATASNAELKAFLQSAQEPATSFFDAFSNFTLGQIKKSLTASRAVEQVLDDPATAKALENPLLKTILAKNPKLQTLLAQAAN